MSISRHDPPFDMYDRLRSECPLDCYAKLSPSAFTGIVSNALLNKTYSSALVMHSADSAGNHIFVSVLNRIDRKDLALDVELYAASFGENSSVAKGCFVHHGNWSGRTTPLSNTALPNLPTMPSSESGHMSDLGEYYNGLYQAGLSALKSCL